MDAKHGDVFPLRIPRCKCGRGQGGRYCDFLHPRGDGSDCRLACAVSALNWCAAASERKLGLSSASKLHSPCPSSTPLRRQVLRRLRDVVTSFGVPPEALDGRSAVEELLRTPDLYRENPHRLACYDPTKLKIFRRRFEPRDIRDVAPPEVRQVFCDLSQIRRGDAEVERAAAKCEKPIYPYWDPKLRDKTAFVDFVWRLRESERVAFSTTIRSRVGAFFVEKSKSTDIRLVVDARLTNFTHHAPPHCALGTPTAWGDLGLDEYLENDARVFDGVGVHPFVEESAATLRDRPLWVAAADLQDAFYQFGCIELAPDFGLDWALPAEEFGCTEALVDGVLQRVGGTTPVFACFCVIPMGWSWALWAVHRTVTHLVSDSSELSPDPLLLEDRRVCPPLRSGLAIASVYVDNVVVFGVDEQKVRSRFNAFMDRAQRVGLLLHEVQDPSGSVPFFDVVGLELDTEKRRLRPKRSKAWKLSRGLVGLSRLRVVAGWQLRIALGHIVHYFQLCPLALSVIGASYAFAFENLRTPVPLWEEVRVELLVLAALAFVVEIDLGAAPSPVAFCGDSSTNGYALHITRISAKETASAVSVRERWRFTPEEKLDRDDGFRDQSAT